MSPSFSKQKFTPERLAKFDGKEDRKCYFAFKGKVFDVTGSFHWQKGRHQVLHNAGEDLTAALENAPHGEEFIKKFPVVGKYIEE